ncbi:lysophospholipid acyltransferase family protein [Pseudohaliea rubra]|uniref:Cell division protein DivIC (FtsB), stabilizes FtsL against RasP cleavage n=1 Tax=Pseudohaliea rubra DSM 19751 TaxID=1265313 RepID=A0A095VP57_9GAMM|nr:lysophospholipid acyltransferase family protein [Pseudohaliea rubra]KGE02908.1 Cell division protein DivIC (FtsB), stabilizes FtsL against RasP cleavage [Pseudohaliea rubra DSM 19751]
MLPHQLLATDNEPLADAEARRRHVERALSVRPAGGWELALAYRCMQQWFSPIVVGAERLPEEPCLFVGNHGLFAVDGLVVLPLMLHDYGRFLRPMGDKFLFTAPRLADFLVSRGATMGHPEVCSALMAARQDILVFPGGAHEAVKSKAEKYRLQWKDRLGFVRLAARHGYRIVPFGLVGPDDFYAHLVEGESLAESFPARWLSARGLLPKDLRRDLVPPLARGSLGTLLPRPQRCYLGFAEALDLSALRGKRVGRARLEALRDEVAGRIEVQLEGLLAAREQDRGQEGLLRRVLNL